jgi:hypothetical protein
MGIGMADVEYLSDRGHLPASKSTMLDIGSQNLFNVTPEAATRFARKYGCTLSDTKLEREVQRLSYFSTPRPGERTAYLSELIDLAPNIVYTSYDVCPGMKTEIFDLNTERLPTHYRNHFNAVLNFGTTEHVINQMNSFEVMHDAVKAGGVIHHQVPSVGWLDHGYFTYHATFFDDLVKANGYELVDRWYTPERMMQLERDKIDIRDAYRPQETQSFVHQGLQLTVQCFNMNVVVRKKHDRAFRVGLELATSHSGLSDIIQSKYRN